MSSSEDDFAWDETDDRGGSISGGFTKRTSRGGKTPNYLESSEEDAASAASDDSHVQLVKAAKKKTSPMKRSLPKGISPKVAKSVLESLSDSDMKDEDKKPASIKDSSQPAAAKSATDTNDANRSDGINVLIPHSLLNKHQGAGKGECTMLVQMDGDGHQLDFHGQSGAVGRFEADERGGQFLSSIFCDILCDFV